MDQPLEEDSFLEEEKKKFKNSTQIVKDCKLYSWGKNKNGELGNETIQEKQTIPCACKSTIQLQINTNHINSISLGGRHSLLVLNNKVYSCGSELLGISGINISKKVSSYSNIQFFNEKKIIKLAAAEFHSLALTSDGRIYSWGGNLHSKLGSTSGVTNGIPILVRSLMKKKIIEIAVGDYHSLALTDHGSLYSWGGGGSSYNKGQCCHGDLIDRELPSKVMYFSDVYVTNIICGGYHTIIVTDDKVMKEKNTISYNNISQNISASHLKLKDKEKSISEKRQYIYGCGSNQYGQCGNGTYEDVLTPQQIVIGEFNNNLLKNNQINKSFQSKFFNDKQDLLNQPIIIKIKCGGHHSIFLSDKGLVYTFGHGYTGQLGLGNTQNYPIPILVHSLSNKFISDIAAGWSHSLVLTKEGHLYATGCGKWGALGMVNSENKKTFTYIEETKYFNIKINNMDGIHAGGHHSLIVLDQDNEYINEKDFNPPSPLKENTCKLISNSQYLYNSNIVTDKDKSLIDTSSYIKIRNKSLSNMSYIKSKEKGLFNINIKRSESQTNYLERKNKFPNLLFTSNNILTSPTPSQNGYNRMVNNENNLYKKYFINENENYNKEYESNDNDYFSSNVNNKAVIGNIIDDSHDANKTQDIFIKKVVPSGILKVENNHIIDNDENITSPYFARDNELRNKSISNDEKLQLNSNFSDDNENNKNNKVESIKKIIDNKEEDNYKRPIINNFSGFKNKTYEDNQSEVEGTEIKNKEEISFDNEFNKDIQYLLHEEKENFSMKNLIFNINSEIIYSKQVNLLHKFIKFEANKSYIGKFEDVIDNFYSEKVVIANLNQDIENDSLYCLCLITEINSGQQVTQQVNYNYDKQKYEENSYEYIYSYLYEDEIFIDTIEKDLSLWKYEFLENFSIYLINQPKFFEIRPYFLYNPNNQTELYFFYMNHLYIYFLSKYKRISLFII